MRSRTFDKSFIKMFTLRCNFKSLLPWNLRLCEQRHNIAGQECNIRWHKQRINNCIIYMHSVWYIVCHSCCLRSILNIFMKYSAWFCRVCVLWQRINSEMIYIVEYVCTMYAMRRFVNIYNVLAALVKQVATYPLGRVVGWLLYLTSNEDGALCLWHSMRNVAPFYSKNAKFAAI